MSAIIGIDLGTTYSALAYVDEIGRPVILRDDQGDNIIPSCVAERDGRMAVGEIARIRAIADLDRKLNNERVGARFKRYMGSSEKHQVGEQKLTPTELSSLILKKLVSLAERKVGTISEAVVTIPANFAHEAREATIQAAKAAGIDIKYIINEPTAAALYYANQVDADMHGHYAVFDLGGGTFDVSIIDIDGEQIRVVASSGVSRLGGDDFDKALVELVAKRYEMEFNSRMDPEDFGRDDAESLKKKLSTVQTADARVGRRDFIEVSRSDFEEEISSLLAQVTMHCETALEEAGLSPDEINSVFLAGGSSRVPAVKSVVERVFKKRPIETANVDEVVALGAALYAARKAGPGKLNAAQSRSVGSVGLQEVAAYYFGTLTLGRDSATHQDCLQNSILIRKNDQIPCSVSEEFFTAADNQQSVQLSVTNSNLPETDPEFAKVIWEGSLPLPPGRPKGQKINVSFSIDENGTMHCHFTDVDTGESVEVDFNEDIRVQSEESPVKQFQID